MFVVVITKRGVELLINFKLHPSIFTLRTHAWLMPKGVKELIITRGYWQNWAFLHKSYYFANGLGIFWLMYRLCWHGGHDVRRTEINDIDLLWEDGLWTRESLQQSRQQKFTKSGKLYHYKGDGWGGGSFWKKKLICHGISLNKSTI